MQPHVTKALDGFGVLEQIRPGHRFADRLDALRKASIVGQSSSGVDSVMTPAPPDRLPAD
jgi:hypothetical protein